MGGRGRGDSKSAPVPVCSFPMLGGWGDSATKDRTTILLPRGDAKQDKESKRKRYRTGGGGGGGGAALHSPILHPI